VVCHFFTGSRGHHAAPGGGASGYHRVSKLHQNQCILVGEDSKIMLQAEKVHD